MKKIVIFGNSGSGKSTLAKELSQGSRLAHLDLETLAWLPTPPPERSPVSDSKKETDVFLNTNSGRIIEGCYSDLLELVIPYASEIFFLNLPINDCIANAKNRPWEPHKYVSLEARNENLEMLVKCITQYGERQDTFSQSSHQLLFDAFVGEKTMYTSNKVE